MKIRPEHYEHMKSAIAVTLAKAAAAHDCSVVEVLAKYRKQIADAGVAKDVDMRVRWDIARASGLSSLWMCDTLYGYINDTHIGTALRRIMREVAYRIVV